MFFFQNLLDFFFFYVIIGAYIDSTIIFESCDSVSPSIETLIEDVKNAKPLSFDVIYELYKPLIESTAKSYALSSFDMDDVKQEAMIALYNAALAYDPSKNVTFGAYAKVCIRNRITSYLRCSQENALVSSIEETEQDPNEPDFETPEEIVISKESLCNLNRRIDEALTDFEKSVFALYIGNTPYAAMANALGKPTKSIDNAIHRIKAKLRKLL